jgi:hypothetical protein
MNKCYIQVFYYIYKVLIILWYLIYKIILLQLDVLNTLAKFVNKNSIHKAWIIKNKEQCHI